MRGGVSKSGEKRVDVVGSSPRAWRCFQNYENQSTSRKVLSTCVEVFPKNGMSLPSSKGPLHVRGGVSKRRRQSRQSGGPLHVRGGVSKEKFRSQIQIVSSPRAWRCFSRSASNSVYSFVLSTCVEVFLILFLRLTPSKSPLHVRGGVSVSMQDASLHHLSSPRAWRCFESSCLQYAVFWSSPRAWRCFPRKGVIQSTTNGPLHVRGGVSWEAVCERCFAESSPRAWRCFDGAGALHHRLPVLSTCVEVFLLASRYALWGYSPLHVRGGVSNGIYSVLRPP